MFKSITYGTFLFFGAMTVLGGLYVYFLIPETNGVALEDMDILFGGKGLATQKMKAYEIYKAERDGTIIHSKFVEDEGVVPVTKK